MEWEPPGGVPVPWDFVLWLYREYTGLTWAQLEDTPRWRIERDLAYIGLKHKAQAWIAHQQQKAAEFEARKQQYRAMMGR